MQESPINKNNHKTPLNHQWGTEILSGTHLNSRTGTGHCLLSWQHYTHNQTQYQGHLGTEADQRKKENICLPSQVHLRECSHGPKWQGERPLLFTSVFFLLLFSFCRAERTCRNHTDDEDASAVHETCGAKFLSVWQSAGLLTSIPPSLT